MAYYCFHEHGMLPTDFLKLSRKEKAVLSAFVSYKTDADTKQRKEIERKAKKR